MCISSHIIRLNEKNSKLAPLRITNASFNPGSCANSRHNFPVNIRYSWLRSSPPSLSGHQKAAWQTRCKFKPAQQVREGNAKCRWRTWLSAPGAQRQTLKTRVGRHCRTSCLYELFIKVRSERGPLVSYQETLPHNRSHLLPPQKKSQIPVTLHPLITRGTCCVSAPLLAEASNLQPWAWTFFHQAFLSCAPVADSRCSAREGGFNVPVCQGPRASVRLHKRTAVTVMTTQYQLVCVCVCDAPALSEGAAE